MCALRRCACATRSQRSMAWFVRSSPFSVVTLLDPMQSLRPGYITRLVSHKSPFVYTQSTVQYSTGQATCLSASASNNVSSPRTALAAQPANFSLITPLLEEALRLNQFLNVQSKRALLQVLAPWTAQCGPFLAEFENVSSRQLLRDDLSCDTLTARALRECGVCVLYSDDWNHHAMPQVFLLCSTFLDSTGLLATAARRC